MVCLHFRRFGSFFKMMFCLDFCYFVPCSFFSLYCSFLCFAVQSVLGGCFCCCCCLCECYGVINITRAARVVFMASHTYVRLGLAKNSFGLFTMNFWRWLCAIARLVSVSCMTWCVYSFENYVTFFKKMFQQQKQRNISIRKFEIGDWFSVFRINNPPQIQMSEVNEKKREKAMLVVLMSRNKTKINTNT